MAKDPLVGAGDGAGDVRDTGLSLGWEDPLEKGKATHSCILAWIIPWSVEFMGSQRVGYD